MRAHATLSAGRCSVIARMALSGNTITAQGSVTPTDYVRVIWDVFRHVRYCALPYPLLSAFLEVPFGLHPGFFLATRRCLVLLVALAAAPFCV